MLLWVTTFVIAASFAAPFYLGWRTLGEHKVTKREARIYTLTIFVSAFLVVGIANIAHYTSQGKPDYGEPG